MSTDFNARFWAKVDCSGGDDSCWPWTAGKTRGYGMFKVGGRMKQASRLSYELLVGPLSNTSVIFHICHNRECVNPAHMSPMNRREVFDLGTSLVAVHAVLDSSVVLTAEQVADIKTALTIAFAEVNH